MRDFLIGCLVSLGYLNKLNLVEIFLWRDEYYTEI